MLLRQRAQIAPMGTAAHTHRNARNKGNGDGAHIIWAGGEEMRRMFPTEE